MQPRFVGRLSLADAVTVSNAAIGFLAVVAATVDPSLAARLVLLAAVADGLDGVIARKWGSSAAGPYLDSLADVASFGVAPAFLVTALAHQVWMPDGTTLRFALAVGIPAVFVAMAVVRLGLYTAYDSGSDETKGAPSTLAATIIAAAVLAGYTGPTILVAGAAILTVLMIVPITYPDLHAQDATVMGIVQVLAIVLTGFLGDAFAFGLLFLSLAYLIFGPRFYWR